MVDNMSGLVQYGTCAGKISEITLYNLIFEVPQDFTGCILGVGGGG